MFRFVKPARLATFRRWVTELVDQLSDAGHVELMSECAQPLPAHLIMRIPA